MMIYEDKQTLYILGCLILLTIVCCIYFSRKIPTIKSTSTTMKKVFIIYTEQPPEDEEETSIHIDGLYKAYDLNISSPQLSINDWNKIGKLIEMYHDYYDIFIIYHPQKSILYTTSAISFMLENLDKPIIFTDNLSKINNTILSYNYPEVILLNNMKMLRGCSTDITLDKENSLIVNNEEFSVKYINPSVKIGIFKLFPDMKQVPDIQNYKAIIFEGPIPESLNNYLIEIIKKNDIIIVGENPNDFILPRYNMSTECIYGKLLYLMSNIKEPEIVRKLYHENFRGELSNLKKNNLTIKEK